MDVGNVIPEDATFKPEPIAPVVEDEEAGVADEPADEAALNENKPEVDELPELPELPGADSALVVMGANVTDFVGSAVDDNEEAGAAVVGLSPVGRS